MNSKITDQDEHTFIFLCHRNKFHKNFYRYVAFLKMKAVKTASKVSKPII